MAGLIEFDVRSGEMEGETIYSIAFGEPIQPDPWQLALISDVWPRVLVAPTGSGKTAAVTLGWAAQRLRSPDSTPRRLVWCLPMRTLVEQTALAVKDWFARLTAEAANASSLPRPEDVHVLMGGVEGGGWLDAPERPAVLVGTQDMLLSRALMRGYASSRALWPMEFALLHEDAQWVFDEVQLMGAGRPTSVQLEAFRRSGAERARRQGRAIGRPSSSLWISATLDPVWLATVDSPVATGAEVVRVDPSMVPDGRLARLSRAPKRLTRSPMWPASPKNPDISDYIRRLAAAILAAHRPGHLTLVVVNRVDRAQALQKELSKRLAAGSAPTLALVHSRFRPTDRKREMRKLVEPSDGNPFGRVVVATQAIEAGVDVSAAVMFTEIAPWSSMVQRFGRTNRYAEHPDGTDVYWVDLLESANDSPSSDQDATKLAAPYEREDLDVARERLRVLTDVAVVHLPPPDDVESPRRVIRRKDLDNLFDTDPDLTGFDVDVSPFIRDADDTDIRVFWRDLSSAGDDPPRPSRAELCAVSIGAARKWLSKLRQLSKGKSLVFQSDPQWRQGQAPGGNAPPGWMPLREDLWSGVTVLADRRAGGYDEAVGFTGNPANVPEPVARPSAPGGTVPDDSDSLSAAETEGLDEDPLSGISSIVPLAEHLNNVRLEAEALCTSLNVDSDTRAAISRAARWHDLGKAHVVFQDTMRRGLDGEEAPTDLLLAKTSKRSRHSRAYFRHELASALAFLAHERWSRDADLVAYLICSHHGKVRMNVRALPREAAPHDADNRTGRFARGVWDGDDLPPFDLGGGEHWEGGSLRLSIMELGWDDVSRESWTERTRELLEKLGPFRLAWLETVLRIADWRASAKERQGDEDDQ